jgi:outer membrane protein
VGTVDITRGDLATALGVDPGEVLTVEGIDQLKLPSSIADSVDQEIDRAFSQRPDLLQQLARLRAANAAIKQARSQSSTEKYSVSLVSTGRKLAPPFS